MSGKRRRLHVLETMLQDAGMIRYPRPLHTNVAFLSVYTVEVDSQLEKLLAAAPIPGVVADPSNEHRTYTLYTITRALTTSERKQLLELIQAARAAEGLDAL